MEPMIKAKAIQTFCIGFRITGKISPKKPKKIEANSKQIKDGLCFHQNKAVSSPKTTARVIPNSLSSFLVLFIFLISLSKLMLILNPTQTLFASQHLYPKAF